jgi:hypothetical protein
LLRSISILSRSRAGSAVRRFFVASHLPISYTVHGDPRQEGDLLDFTDRVGGIPRERLDLAEKEGINEHKRD